MATLAVAQVAEMREAGVFVEDAITCGHSVGEYNALAAVTGILPLEALLEIVFRRGMAMHHLVPRDAAGPEQLPPRRDPPLADRASPTTTSPTFVAASSRRAPASSSRSSTTTCVARSTPSRARLPGSRRSRRRSRSAAHASTASRPSSWCPGIDVPFHSSELHAGVDDFRQRLDDLLPEKIDPSLLIGRYIPNLVPRLFTLDRAYVEEVADLVDSPLLKPVLEDWATWEADPARLGRALLIELLAWQFASPVRWIETQDLMFGSPEHGGLGIEQFVEIGVANAPTLANLASQTTKLPSYDGVAPKIVNSSRDAAVVFATDTPMPDDEPEDDDPTPTTRPSPRRLSLPKPRTRRCTRGCCRRRSSRGPVLHGGRRDQDPGRAAYQGASRPDRPRRHDRGAVRRRLLAPQPAARRPRCRALARCDRRCRRGRLEGTVGHGHQAGPHLLAVRPGADRGRERAAAQVRWCCRRQVRPRSPTGSSDTWQLGPGWVSHVSAELAAGLRDGSSTRGGSLGYDIDLSDLNAVVDHAVQAVGQAQGVQVSMPATGGGEGAMVDSAALDEITESITGTDGVLASTARHLLGKLGHTEPAVVEDRRTTSTPSS